MENGEKVKTQKQEGKIAVLHYAHGINLFAVALFSFYLSFIPVCGFVLQVSGEVFLPHAAGLLAPCLAGALLPESTQGQ